MLNYVQYYPEEEHVTQLRVAILLAARWGQLEVLALLTSRLPRFAHFNEYFLEAVEHDQLLAAQFLRKGIDGPTLHLGLDKAAVAGYPAIVQYLLGESGSIVSKEVAVEVASRGHLEVVRVLLNKAPWGWQALEAAYLNGHSAIVRFLVNSYNNIWNVKEYYAKASQPDLMELLAQRLKELKLEQERERQRELELERAASWESFKRRYGL